MTVAKHGVSTDTPDRLLIDAGAVYLGFLDIDNPGTLLGATRGGNVFELTRNIRRMEADGAKGPVKGMRRIESVDAVIKAKMLEMTAENLRLAIAAARYSSGMSTISSESQENGNNSQDLWQLGLELENCEDAWDEQVVTGVTPSLDSGDFVCGAGSAKFVVASGASSGILASEVISIAGSTLDDFTRLGLRIKSSIALTVGQLQILISSSANGANAEVTVDLPAIAADTWTKVNVPADFSGCTGLTMISIAISQSEDLGAFNLWLDEVKAVRQNLELNSETVVVNSVTKTRGTDYAVDYDNGEIQFYSTPGSSHTVVVSYKTRTYGVDAVITGSADGLATDDNYIDTVAIIGTISNKSDPVIIKITNALCDAGFSLSMAPKDEAVVELTFSAHYISSDLDAEPWSITYPAS